MTSKWRFVLIVSLIGNLTIAYVGYKAWEYRSHINEFRDLYYQVIEEFADRRVYAEQNQALRSDATVPDRVVFIGSQVTQHWDLQKSFPWLDAVNRGIIGQRAAGFLLRFRPDVIDLAPRAVVIEVSSYNLRPNMPIDEARDFAASMAELADNNHITPILTTMIAPVEGFQVFEHPEYHVKDSVDVYNRWLLDYARRHNFAVADFKTAVSDETGYLDPALAATHVDPNTAGYERLTAALTKALATIGLTPAGTANMEPPGTRDVQGVE